MRALVVYESLWGNTAALGRAVAAGLGSDARALSTSESTAESLSGADLLVLGAPVHSYGLPEFVAIQAGREPQHGADGATPDSERRFMRDWLGGLPPVGPPTAVFEIRIENLEGEGGAGEVLEALSTRGYRLVAPAESFRMERLPMAFGPGAWMRPEELERARKWGARLAEIVQVE